VLADDKEYQLYNPGKQCYWQTLLAFYDEKISEPCSNCNSCQPDYVSLVDLGSGDEEHTEREEVKDYVKTRLEELATTLDRKTQSYLLDYCEDIVNEQVLTKEWRDKISRKYYRVACGDLLGWPWTKKYGCEVIHTVCTAAGLPIPSTNQSSGQPMASQLSASQLSSSIPTSLSFVTSTATPLMDNGALKDITNHVAITPRGAPATLNKKGTGRKTRSTVI
jgi:hypothetical protein